MLGLAFPGDQPELVDQMVDRLSRFAGEFDS